MWTNILSVFFLQPVKKVVNVCVSQLSIWDQVTPKVERSTHFLTPTALKQDIWVLLTVELSSIRRRDWMHRTAVFRFPKVQKIPAWSPGVPISLRLRQKADPDSNAADRRLSVICWPDCTLNVSFRDKNHKESESLARATSTDSNPSRQSSLTYVYTKHIRYVKYWNSIIIPFDMVSLSIFRFDSIRYFH